MALRISGNDNGAMEALKRSATGQKLLAEAEKRGVKIQFAADNGDNTMGQYNPNNNTITVESGNIEKMTEVLAHELVHATTKDNGNSMQEEKLAFQIGEKVAGEAGVNYNPHDASYWNNHVNKAYSGLSNDNGIMNALNALGVTADGITANNLATGVNNNTANNYAAEAPNAAAGVANNADPFAAANQNNPLANMQNQMQGGLLQMIMMLMQMIMKLMMGQGNNLNQNNTNQQNALYNQLPQNAPALSMLG
ncbi:MAG: DUF6782 family putative metallopeptidase [Cyanobacteriota bacterium]